MISAAVTSAAGASGTTSAGGLWVMFAVGPSLEYILAATQTRCGKALLKACRYGWRRDNDMVKDERFGMAATVQTDSGQSANRDRLDRLVMVGARAEPASLAC